ncbi:MAG: hypothetical protein ACRDBX_05060 [Erysipelotrichaceae bacterium]
MIGKLGVLIGIIALGLSLSLQVIVSQTHLEFGTYELQLVQEPNELISEHHAILLKESTFDEVERGDLIVYEENLYRIGYKAGTSLMLNDASILDSEKTFQKVEKIFPNLKTFIDKLNSNSWYFFGFDLLIISLLVAYVYFAKKVYPTELILSSELAHLFDKRIQEYEHKSKKPVDSVNMLKEDVIDGKMFDRLLKQYLELVFTQIDRCEGVEILAKSVERSIRLQACLKQCSEADFDFSKIHRAFAGTEYHIRERIHDNDFYLMIEFKSTI